MIDKKYLIGIGILVILLPADFLLFLGTRWLYASVLLSVILAVLPFFLIFLQENKRQKRMDDDFLTFVRGLVEGVKSGVPIPQAILNLKDKNFGVLTKYVKKLAYQIEWGVPVKDALVVFARDTKNSSIKRSVSILIQAEESGGNIDDVLGIVVDSVLDVKKLRDERKSTVYSQVVQGYVVFFIFIGVMLIMELKLVPMIEGMVGGLSGGLSGGFLETETASSGIDINFKLIFTSLILIQGLFGGMIIGKFSEGSIKYGLKHSFILIAISLLVVFTFAPPGT